jgi:hypothetical protein
MAEIVASAVVGETLSRISTFLIDKPDQKSSHVERLEMAHIKMEAALQISNKWQITDVPMLRWRSKLKRAAEECDETLRHCKQRAMEDEAIRQGISQSPFPKRFAHAAKSFIISSFITHGKAESSSPVNVRRFERFAEGAGEFLKFVEFGAIPRQYMSFNPLIRHLLAGQALRYQALRGSRFYYLGIRPMSFEERGVEAMVGFYFQDIRAPTKNFSLGFMLRLSESSDIFEIIISCMQSVTPHFRVAAEVIKRELIRLPTQDFSWRTPSPYGETLYWVDVHKTLTQWFRPNPICCNEHEHDLLLTHGSSRRSNPNLSLSPRSRLAVTFSEQVIVVHLQFHISGQNKRLQNSATRHGRKGSSSTMSSESSLLKLGVLFIPHDSPEGIEPTAESFAFEVIDGKEQEMVHRNASLQDVDEKLLPKAIDYLFQNSESRLYQICLRSRHGTAHLCVEKTTAQVRSAGIGKSSRSQSQVRNGRSDQKQGEYRVDGCQKVSRDLLKLWVVRASDKLHGSIRSWTDNSLLGATNR